MSYSWRCKVHRICAFPPEGAGRFGASWWSSEGADRRSSVMAHVSTADSTLMVGGGGLNGIAIAAAATLASWPHSCRTQCSLLINPRKKKNTHKKSNNVGRPRRTANFCTTFSSINEAFAVVQKYLADNVFVYYPPDSWKCDSGSILIHVSSLHPCQSFHYKLYK